MPQMRGVMPGISEKGRPSQNFSKPRNSTTWNSASETFPASSIKILILAWPSIRVTGSIRMRLAIRTGSAEFQLRPFQFDFRPAQNLGHQRFDAIDRRRAARQEMVDMHGLMHGQYFFKQCRHDARF